MFFEDDVAAEFLGEKYRRSHSAKTCSDPSEPHTREICPEFSPRRRMAVFVFASDPGAGDLVPMRFREVWQRSFLGAIILETLKTTSLEFSKWSIRWLITTR
jgi:hypothetical protein